MAYNFFHIDKGLSLKPQAAAPAIPKEGDLYYDSVSENLRIYNGSEWTNLPSGYLKPNTNTDNSSGSNITLSAVSSGIVELTSASLTSFESIPAPTQAIEFILINRTGNSITIKNETGATSANRIKTGTSADIILKNGSSLFLIYSEGESRWLVLNSVGSHTNLSDLSSDDHLQYLNRDGSRPMESELDVGNNKIINLAEPANSNDAANKEFVERIAYYFSVVL